MHPLVLIPGLNNTAAVFDGVVECLRKEGVEALACDCPAIADLDALARELLATLPDRFWLGGFSFGGYVALSMLAQAPERVQGLALICSSPQADTPAQSAAREAAIAKAMEGDYAQLIAAQAPMAFHADSLQKAGLMAQRAAMVTAYGRDRFVAHQRAAIGRPDRTGLLRAPLPMLWVTASDDRLFTPAAMEPLARSIEGMRYAQIDKAGHLAPMEQPHAVAQALAQWMGRSPS